MGKVDRADLFGQPDPFGQPDSLLDITSSSKGENEARKLLLCFEVFCTANMDDAKLLNLLAWQAREDCVNLPGTVDEYKEADNLANSGLTTSVGHLDVFR